MAMLTTTELISWFLALGVAKVDQAKITSPFDLGTTRYLTKPPAFGSYYTVSDFPSDDTGGAPLTAISLKLAPNPVESDSDACYRDGSICFDADPAGVITAIRFGESYAGSTIGEPQPIPTTLSELQQLIESFKAEFRAFLQHMDEPPLQEEGQ